MTLTNDGREKSCGKRVKITKSTEKIEMFWGKLQIQADREIEIFNTAAAY